MAAYFNCDYHVWREVINSHLRMARENTDKLMDTRAESKLKNSSHRGPSLVAESQAFSRPRTASDAQASCMVLELRHRHCI